MQDLLAASGFLGQRPGELVTPFFCLIYHNSDLQTYVIFHNPELKMIRLSKIPRDFNLSIHYES